MLKVFKCSIGVALLFLISCDRKTQDESARISFTVPAAQKISALGGTVEPADLSEINCFYVVAAGPEAAMSNVKCGRKLANGGVEQVLTGGMIVGGVRSTSAAEPSSFEFDVPAGSDRVFYLLGTKYQNNGYCLPFATHKFYSSHPNRSNVYILSKSSPLDLQAGGKHAVDMPMALNADHWIDTCDGTSPPPVQTPNAPATRLAIAKDSYPSRMVVGGQCQPFEFHLTNDLDIPATLSSNLTVQVETMSPISVSVSDPDWSNKHAGSYGTRSACVADTGDNNWDGSFTIAAGQTSVKRWIRMPAKLPGETRTHPPVFMFMTPGLATIIPQHFTKSAQAPGGVNMITNAVKYYSLTGPKLIGEGQCIQYRVDAFDWEGFPSSLTGYGYRISNYGNSYRVYSDANCTTDITTTPVLSAQTIYLKTPGLTGSGRKQLVINQGNSLSHNTRLTYLEIFVAGDSTPTGLKVEFPVTFQDGMCTPVQISLVNSLGATVQSGPGHNGTFTATGAAIYGDANCTSSVTSPATFSIAAGTSNSTYYIRSTSTGVVQLTATSSGLTQHLLTTEVQDYL